MKNAIKKLLLSINIIAKNKKLKPNKSGAIDNPQIDTEDIWSPANKGIIKIKLSPNQERISSMPTAPLQPDYPPTGRFKLYLPEELLWITIPEKYRFPIHSKIITEWTIEHTPHRTPTIAMKIGKKVFMYELIYYEIDHEAELLRTNEIINIKVNLAVAVSPAGDKMILILRNWR